MRISHLRHKEVRTIAECEDCEWTHFSHDKEKKDGYYKGRDNTRKLTRHHVQTNPGHKVKYMTVTWYSTKAN